MSISRVLPVAFFALSLLFSGQNLFAQDDAVEGDVRKLELRMYNLADYFQLAPDCPARKLGITKGRTSYLGETRDDLIFPQLKIYLPGMGGGGMGGGSGMEGGGMFNMAPEKIRKTTEPDAVLENDTSANGLSGKRSYFAQLGGGMGTNYSSSRPVNLNRSIIDPIEVPDMLMGIITRNQWGENGGDCEATILGSQLCVTHTPTGHQQIKAVLEELRQQCDPRISITIEADWVAMTREELRKLVPEGNSVNEKQWATIEPEYSTRFQGLNGQVFSAVTGTQKNFIFSVVPCVGDDDTKQGDTSKDEPRQSDVKQLESRMFSSVGYRPVVSVVHSGMAIEVLPIIGADHSVAQLDISAQITELQEPSPQVKKTPARPGPEDLRASSDLGLAEKTVQAVDRIEQEVALVQTSVRVPVGTRVLIGGDKDSFYLFVKLTIAAPKKGNP